MRIVAVAVAILLAGCTPHANLLMALVPDGTIPTVLGNLQGVADANRQRIVELESRGDWEGLAKFADDNLAKDRFNADWWFVAGYARTQLKQHARAVDAYGETVRIDPQNAMGWHALAQAYRNDSRSDRAVRVLEQYALVHRDSPMTLYLLGESLSDLKRWPEAAKVYRELLNLDGRLAEAWFGLGRAQARLGRAKEAREALSVLEQSAPHYAAALAREIDPR